MAASDKKGKSNSDDDLESLSKLLIETFETSVHASVKLAKIPLVMCKSMTKSWAKAIDSMLDELADEYDSRDPK